MGTNVEGGAAKNKCIEKKNEKGNGRVRSSRKNDSKEKYKENAENKKVIKMAK